MIKRKTQNFSVKQILTYCLENLYIDDFHRHSLYLNIGFLLLMINRHAKINFLEDYILNKNFIKINKKLCRKNDNDLF